MWGEMGGERERRKGATQRMTQRGGGKSTAPPLSVRVCMSLLLVGGLLPPLADEEQLFDTGINTRFEQGKSAYVDVCPNTETMRMHVNIHILIHIHLQKACICMSNTESMCMYARVMVTLIES